MILAEYLSLSEDALICDMAETYGIYDIYQFKPSYIGTLAHGLRSTSRIKQLKTGIKVSDDMLIAAYSADKLANLVWMLSEDGSNGLKKPKSILNILLKQDEPKADRDVVSYDSPEEFEAAMKKYER